MSGKPGSVSLTLIKTYDDSWEDICLDVEGIYYNADGSCPTRKNSICVKVIGPGLDHDFVIACIELTRKLESIRLGLQALCNRQRVLSQMPLSLSYFYVCTGSSHRMIALTDHHYLSGH